MIIAAIDWSMTSPSIVVGKVGCSDSELDYYSFKQAKKQSSNLKNVHLCDYPQWSCPEERFLKLSEWALGIITDHGVHHAFIEGYAYGSSKGVVFEIGENTGVLKQTLYTTHVPFTVYAPTVIKKFATGKGNANKIAMEEAYRTKTGIDLCLAINDKATATKIPSPVSDMVDAYWIYRYAESLILVKPQQQI